MPGRPITRDRASEQLLRAILDHSRDIHLALARDGTILYQGPQATRIVEFVSCEPGEPRLQDCVHPEDRSRLQEELASLQGLGPPKELRCEFRLRHRNGEWRWFEAVVANLLQDPAVAAILVNARDVTDRKTAEGRLAESEAQFRLALGHEPIGNALALPDGRLLQVNRRLCDLLGYEAAQLMELGSLAAVTHRSDLDAERALQEELCAGARSTYDVEKRLIRRDGSAILTSTHVAAIRGGDGQLLYMLSEIEDVTTQRSTEAALRTSEALLRAVTENVPDLLLLLDLDLRIRFANRSVLGTPPAQLIGRSVLDFVPLAEQADVSAVYQRAIQTREPQVYEVRAHVGGEPRWFENRVGLVIQDDCIVSVTVASSEITARRRGEEALRTQGRILDTMREGVVVIDGSSMIRLVNPAMARLTGYEPRDLLGRSGHVFTRRSRNEYLQLMADLDRKLAADQFVDMEHDCVRRDGTTFTAACVMTRIEIGGERHRLAVLEDITQRRELEHEIIEIANREQRRIGSDLHDGLGQELTGVALMLRGLAGRLRKEGAAAAPEAEEIVGLVNGAIDNARSLARGLSPVSIERGGLTFAIRALCTRASDMYGVQVRFRSKVWPQLTLDTAPSNHLYRIAQEAVTNAVKHGRATEIVVDLIVTGEHVQLVITDNGTGLPPDVDLAQGMGMKIMRYRANMVGGTVGIGPAPGGVGTRVTMACIQPAYVQPAPARETGDEQSPQ